MAGKIRRVLEKGIRFLLCPWDRAQGVHNLPLEGRSKARNAALGGGEPPFAFVSTVGRCPQHHPLPKFAQGFAFQTSTSPQGGGWGTAGPRLTAHSRESGNPGAETQGRQAAARIANAALAPCVEQWIPAFAGMSAGGNVAHMALHLNAAAQMQKPARTSPVGGQSEAFPHLR